MNGTILKAYENGELIGIIAINDTVNGVSSGGIRLVAAIDEDSMLKLAYNQTLKNGFLGISVGGAKGAVIATPENKEKNLRSFGSIFSHSLVSTFNCGVDIGLTKDDMATILDSAGIKNNARNWSNKSHIYTAYSVLASAKTLTELSGKRVSIEGIGGVGLSLLKLLKDEKIRLIAVSTAAGSIINEEGIDIGWIIKLKEQFNDEFVKEKNNKKYKNRPSGDLLSIDTDILFPCAAPFSIHEKNVRQVSTRFIVPAANLPATDYATAYLERKGILIVPSYISNSGGVYGSYHERIFSELKLRKNIESMISDSIKLIIAKSKSDKATISTTAEKLTLQKYLVVKDKAEKDFMSKRIRSVLALSNKGKYRFLKIFGDKEGLN